jgi:DnaJ-class molecular chaperone
MQKRCNDYITTIKLNIMGKIIEKPKTPKKVNCPKCNGTGKISGKTCSTCKGTGKLDLLLD